MKTKFARPPWGTIPPTHGFIITYNRHAGETTFGYFCSAKEGEMKKEILWVNQVVSVYIENQQPKLLTYHKMYFIHYSLHGLYSENYWA